MAMTTPTNTANLRTTHLAELVYTSENKKMMPRLVRNVTLPKGVGPAWREPGVGAVDAYDLDELTEFNNPQTVQTFLNAITPAERGTQVLWPKRMNLYNAKDFVAISARVRGAAIEYKRDRDLLTLLASALGSYTGGIPVNVGTISAMMAPVQAGTTASQSGTINDQRSQRMRATGDPTDPPWFALAHTYNQHDLRSQLTGLGIAPGATTGTVGTANIPAVAGLSEFNAEQIARHYRGNIAEASFVVTSNLSIGVPAANQVQGGVFAKQFACHVEYQGVQNYEVLTEDGRFMKQTTWVDYGFGIVQQTAVRSIAWDTTVPTS